MDLQDRLMADLRESMRAGDTERRESIRMLRAAIKNEEIALRHPLSADEATAVVGRIAKRHRESIEQFERANRRDLVEHEQAQLAALESYLPTMMSRDEIELEVRAAMAETGTSGPRAQGQIMSTLAQRLRGRAELSEVSKVVKAVLDAGLGS